MKRKATIFTAAAFVLMFSICCVFVYILVQNNIAALRKKVAEIGSAQAYSLQRQLDRSLSSTYALAAFIHQYGAIENFDELAADMIERYGGISSLQLAPGAVVRQIYPLPGNEAAIGHDLLNDPKRRTETLKTIESRQLTVAGPLTLIQGGTAVIGRYPIFVHRKMDSSPDTFWGFAIALIRLPELIEASNLNQLVLNGYDYTLSRIHPDTRQLNVFAESGRSPLTDPVAIDMAVPNGTWTLSVAPSGGWLPRQMIGFGIVLSVLLSLAIAGLFYRQMKSSSERKTLEKEILSIEDRERRRISYDLHDDLGQLLTGLSFKSSSLEYDLREKRMPEADDAAKISLLIENAKNKAKVLSKWIAPVDHDEQGLAPALDDLASYTRQIFEVQCSACCDASISIKNKAKVLSKWIAPVDHDEQGLAPALDDLALYTRQIFEVRCSARCDASVSIKNDQITSNLYRIAQEAVSNAVRHSGAISIEIALTKKNNSVIMTVRDNGTGFDRSRASAGGMGIQIMNYRARIIGATLKISDIQGGGTCVTCRCPLQVS